MQTKDDSRSNRYPGSEDIDLTQFDEDFADAQVEEKRFGPIPDGKYHVNVEQAELTQAKKSRNPMLKWTLRILGPHDRGRLLWRNNVMATRENIKWLKNDLQTCGLDLAKLSELPENLERLINVRLEVTKRTRGQSENIFFNRRIDFEAKGPDDGDIPF
jgi:hypothetical protein